MSVFKYALFLNLFQGHDKRARQVPIGIFGMDTSLLSISKHKKIVLACMPVSSHLEAYAVVPFCPPFPEGGDQEGQRRAYVRGVAEMGREPIRHHKPLPRNGPLCRRMFACAWMHLRRRICMHLFMSAHPHLHQARQEKQAFDFIRLA